MIKINNEIDRKKILLAAEDARNIYCKNGEGSTGACIESSRWISHHSAISLKKVDIKHNMVFGRFLCKTDKKYNSHTWIEFPQYDHAILDVTADQFGNYPKIWFPADKRCYQKIENYK